MSTELGMEEIVRSEFLRVFGEGVPYSRDLTKNDVPGWDSLRWVAFLVAVERRSGIRFPAARVAAMRTLGEVVGYLANQPPPGA